MKGIPQANDSAFTGRRIRLKSKNDIPDDSALMSPDRGIAGITRGLEGTNTGESPPKNHLPENPGPGKEEKEGDGAGGDDESIN